MVVELPDGVLKMFMQTDRGYLYESVSTDFGETWQGEIATAVRMPNTSFCVKTDPYSGYQFLVWIRSFLEAKDSRYPGTAICLGVSRDDTRTREFLCKLDKEPLGQYDCPCLYFTQTHVCAAYQSRWAPDEKSEELRIKRMERRKIPLPMHELRQLFPEKGAAVRRNQAVLTRYISPQDARRYHSAGQTTVGYGAWSFPGREVSWQNRPTRGVISTIR